MKKKTTIPLKEKVYNWQRFFKKDLGGCELKNEKEISELRAKIATLLEENKEQKRLLSAPLPKSWQFLTVKAIGSNDETVEIDAGNNEKVMEGMVAVLQDTYLGKVSKVSEGISQIKLATFGDEKLVVKIVSTDSSISGKGLLVGLGQGRMRVEQILFSENVKKSDLVLTNIEGGDLLIGKIEEVVEVKGEPFKSALVKRLFNPEELNTIFLIRGKL